MTFPGKMTVLFNKVCYIQLFFVSLIYFVFFRRVFRSRFSIFILNNYHTYVSPCYTKSLSILMKRMIIDFFFFFSFFLNKTYSYILNSLVSTGQSIAIFFFFFFICFFYYFLLLVFVFFFFCYLFFTIFCLIVA